MNICSQMATISKEKRRKTPPNPGTSPGIKAKPRPKPRLYQGKIPEISEKRKIISQKLIEINKKNGNFCHL